MKNKKNINSKLVHNANKQTSTVNSEDDERILHHAEPDDYMDQYFYDKIYYTGACMSCRHWNGSRCSADNAVCIYE